MLRVLQINRNVRSIRRYRHIVRVLTGHGLYQLLDYLNLAHLVSAKRRRSYVGHLSPQERLRHAMEELGPTFIKLGQLLSTRADIIPPPFVAEFSLLQDRVPSIPFEDIKRELELELGGPVESFFSRLDTTAMAAASIAQVHRARLVSGADVVVKVRRPGVVQTVETDIDILIGMALLLERHMPRSELYDPVGVVREFAHTIRREMDLSKEGHAIEKIRDNFAGNPTLCFPRVYWETTTHGVLTTGYVNGIKVSDVAAIDAAGLDRKIIAQRGADVFLKMVLDHGYFHADPHPGNVLILPDNVICLLDFGMVGRLDPGLKGYLADLLSALIDRDVDAVVTILFDAGEVGENLNVSSLKRSVAEFVDSYFDIPLKEIQVGRVLLAFIDLISIHRIKLHPDLALLIKVLVTVEGMGRELDPDFDMVAHLRPFLEGALRERYSPSHIAKETAAAAQAYLSLFKNLPREIREILKKINRNKFRIDLEHRGLDRFGRELERSANRVSLSLILAALIIGSSIAMQSGQGPLLFGLPGFALIGYASAAVVGLWWVVAILRSGRL